jgi:mono/diheme cytochrome c family protein
MHALTRYFVCAGSILFCLKAGPLAGQSPPPPANSSPSPIARTVAQMPSHSPAAAQNLPTGPLLVFDSDTKQYDASPGEAAAPFVFNLTNVWTNEIVIDRVQASCGCTTASMPAVPWHIPPSGGGQVHAQVNLAGKMGLITKTLTFRTSVGPRIAYLKVNIPAAPASGGTLSQSERKAAMARAAADPRAIFQGDCVKCHVEKGRNALGEDLYAADCGICHESSHRQSVVPDLHALKQVTDLEYWKAIITLGKPHGMMPGFGAAQGGPLSDAQVISLATYLDRTISHHLTSTMTNSTAASIIPTSILR